MKKICNKVQCECDIDEIANVSEPEPTLIVETEPDYWNRGHYHEGSKPYIDPTAVWKLPIGTKLYTSPPSAPCKSAWLVDLGHGKIGVHRGRQPLNDGEFPCIVFSQLGTGVIGAPTNHPSGEQINERDWIGSIVFRNNTSMKVLADELSQLLDDATTQHEPSGNRCVEIEQEATRRAVWARLRQLAQESWNGDKPNWKEALQDKWYLYYSYAEEVWKVDSCSQMRDPGNVYFASHEAAEDAIKVIGEDSLMSLLLED